VQIYFSSYSFTSKNAAFRLLRAAVGKFDKRGIFHFSTFGIIRLWMGKFNRQGRKNKMHPKGYDTM